MKIFFLLYILKMEEKVICIECQQYFKNLDEWKKEHEKLSYQVMNVKHNYLIEGNNLGYIFQILVDNKKITKLLNEQNNEIKNIKKKLNYYEDILKNDVFFESNINIRYTQNKNLGRCLIHFFPKSIHFRIEYQGDISFTQRKEFEIEILFPFKESKIKYSSIEKLQGCIFGQKVMNTSEQETIIYNGYSSYINQRNKITSIKLLRNYYSVGLLEKKNIDICISGILTFSDFEFNSNKPSILYNIGTKRFIYYKDFQWKFIENCFSEDGNIKKECIINLEFDYENKELYINNQFSYLGHEGNFETKEKNKAKFQFEFYSEYYYIIKITSNNRYLSDDFNTGLIQLSNEENYFIAYNI